MRRVRIATGFAIVLSGTTAIAEEPVPSGASRPASQAAAKSAYQNQLTCTTSPSIGSHIPTKKCKTQAQLDADRRQAQTDLLGVQRQGHYRRGEGG